MERKPEYLKDSTFLKNFDKEKLKEQYVRICSLDWNERELGEVQGRISSGSVNVNGSSAVRRTLNTNVILQDVSNDPLSIKNLFSLNKKIKVYKGFKNTTNKYREYDIIWFKVGTFVITDMSISQSLGGINFSVTAQDKMCLLNGTCGGTLGTSITFNKVQLDDGTFELIPIFDIVKELVNHLGKEQLPNIIIDVPKQVKKLVKWSKKDPIWYRKKEDREFEYSFTEGSVTEWKKAEAGDVIGYVWTDFIWTGNSDLTIAAGGSITNALDDLVAALGNYEYFYDVDGVFHFQEIKNYLNTTHASEVLTNLTNESYLVDTTKGKSVYNFDSSELISAYNNNPHFQNIKNDYVAWGSTAKSKNIKNNIRYRLCIDSKPKELHSYTFAFYTDMYGDKRAVNYFDISAKKEDGKIYYDKNEDKFYTWDIEKKILVEAKDENDDPVYSIKTIEAKDWRTELYFKDMQNARLGLATSDYYADLKEEWPKSYDIVNGHFKDLSTIPYFLDFIDTGSALSNFSVGSIGRRTINYQNDDVNCLFRDDYPTLYLIPYYAEDIEEQKKKAMFSGNNYMIMNEDVDFDEDLTIFSQQISALDVVRNMLYQYTQYNENISITAIPIYYLEPNTRITVNNPEAGMFGDYVLNTIALPLDAGGTMQLSATKALQKF